MPGNHPKESIQHSAHGESLKSRTNTMFNCNTISYKQIPLVWHIPLNP